MIFFFFCFLARPKILIYLMTLLSEVKVKQKGSNKILFTERDKPSNKMWTLASSCCRPQLLPRNSQVQQPTSAHRLVLFFTFSLLCLTMFLNVHCFFYLTKNNTQPRWWFLGNALMTFQFIPIRNTYLMYCSIYPHVWVELRSPATTPSAHACTSRWWFKIADLAKNPVQACMHDLQKHHLLQLLCTTCGTNDFPCANAFGRWITTFIMLCVGLKYGRMMSCFDEVIGGFMCCRSSRSSQTILLQKVTQQ